jgi:spermidine/putrescine-binding protein
VPARERQTRRDVLHQTVALATATLSLALAAPPAFATPDTSRPREAKMVMRALALRGSVPQHYVSDFRTALEGYGIAAVSYKPTLADVWLELEGSKKSKFKRTTVDAITVGDASLDEAIARGLIQPIASPERYRYYSALNARWRHLTRRGEHTYGIPYRWGCTVVVYRKDRLQRYRDLQLADWDDLLDPRLTGKVAFMDNPREIVGIALKTLGLRYNSSAADVRSCGLSTEDVRRRVSQLVSQAKVISNKDHVRAYAAGDVDALVGSSDDLIPLAQRSSNSVIMIPASGTALFADLWCVPIGASGGATDGTPSPLLPAWFELCLSPVRANGATGLSGGVSPLLMPNSTSSRGACRPIKTNEEPHLIGSRELPSIDVLQRSEFLEHLDADTLAMYQSSLL